MPFLHDVDDFPAYVENDLARLLGSMYQALSDHPLIVMKAKMRFKLVVTFKVRNRAFTINIYPSADNLSRDGKADYGANILLKHINIEFISIISTQIFDVIFGKSAVTIHSHWIFFPGFLHELCN